MAKMSVDQVIEEVFDDQSEENDVPTVSEVVDSAVEKFKVLKSSLDSFQVFREEASEVLLEVY